MNFPPFVISSGRDAVRITSGVDHVGSSSRSMRQAGVPVATSKAVALSSASSRAGVRHHVGGGIDSRSAAAPVTTVGASLDARPS